MTKLTGDQKDKRRKRRGYIVEDVAGQSTVIPDDFMTCMHDFLRDTIARGCSDHTVTYYQEHLTTFYRTLEAQGVVTRLNRLTEDIIRDRYIMYRIEKDGVQRGTVSAGLRALRAFLNWAVKKRIIEVSPMGDIVVNSKKTNEVQTFTRDQMRDILSQPDLQTFVGVRDYTIMVVLMETGIRLRELIDMKINDIRWGDSQIAILGKNGQVRLVPFQKKCAKILKRYLEVRGESDVDNVFITQDDGKLSNKSIQDRIKIYGRRANIKGVRCSPHTFRHTFAKMSVMNGADIFALQKILGHSTLEMVRVYVNMFSGEVADAHRKFSPIENLI